MIRVLIVEDLDTVRELLIYILSTDPQVQVVGVARNGEEAIEAAKRHKPDVITMDIQMPKVDGIEATRTIMETTPTPIIVVSGSLVASERNIPFEAMQAGALNVMGRPKGLGHPEFGRTSAELIRMIKLMAEVKVVRRWGETRASFAKNRELSSPVLKNIPSGQNDRDIKIVAMGASTGGPPVLKAIFSSLPSDFPVPILVVQHMLEGFIEGFSEWLGKSCSLPVHVAKAHQTPLAGHIYLATDGYHLGVDHMGYLQLSDHQPESGIRPSISYLFRTVVDQFRENAVGVLLTGMGKDGAEDLKRMKDAGAVTITQDEESSVVFEMPGEAIKCGAASYVLAPQGIAEVLNYYVRRSTKSKVNE